MSAVLKPSALKMWPKDHVKTARYIKQNVYDDPKFFAAYEALRRSERGLNAAWNGPRSAVSCPDCRGIECSTSDAALVNTAVARAGAASVVRVDLSERMLERARAMTSDSAIEYRCCAIEDLNLAPAGFDLVTSSLALHYVSDFDAIRSRVAHCLSRSGDFAFSVEHPIMTALESQGW